MFAAGGEARVEARKLLAEVRERLLAVYGPRLKKVVLYGSEARGDATADSDIDILVVLDGPVAYGAELRRIIEVLYPLQRRIVRPLDALPVDVSAYESGDWSLYRHAREEGLAA